MMLSETDPADITAPDSYNVDVTATVAVNTCTLACLKIDGNRYSGVLFGAENAGTVAGPVTSKLKINLVLHMVSVRISSV